MAYCCPNPSWLGPFVLKFWVEQQPAQFTSVFHALSNLLAFMLLVLLIEDYALTFLYI